MWFDRLRRRQTEEAERREPGAANLDGLGRGEACEDDRRIDGSCAGLDDLIFEMETGQRHGAPAWISSGELSVRIDSAILQIYIYIYIWHFALDC